MEVHFFHEDIEKFFYSLEEFTFAKIIRMITRLERFGNHLGMPHSKMLMSGIFELRIRGVQEIRILYTFHNNSAVLLNGFIKKTSKTPERNIDGDKTESAT